MTDKEEWGPWVDHDGKGCPCVGMYVHRVSDRPGYNPESGAWVSELIGIVRSREPWIWGTNGYIQIIRYRIRKPRALMDLIELVENLPAPVGPKVDA